MGLFADDDLQDVRLDALEEPVRTAAASESWATLQEGACSAAETLRESLAAAKQRLEQG